MHITKMTIVQQKAIPQIFSGKDILVRSQTGSGKTLAYALPIVECLHKIRPKLSRNSGLKALIVVPTRELALQTYECFLKLIKVSAALLIIYRSLEYISIHFPTCLAIYVDRTRISSRW